MTITVRGNPKPQGSKRFVGLSKAGRGILIESCKDVKNWREAVKWAAFEHCMIREDPIVGPVRVKMIFTLPKPKSAPKRRLWPDRKPDLSKLVRSTEDALTDAGVWEDDARIVSCDAHKVYVGDGCALDVPGAVIRIEAVS